MPYIRPDQVEDPIQRDAYQKVFELASGTRNSFYVLKLCENSGFRPGYFIGKIQDGGSYSPEDLGRIASVHGKYMGNKAKNDSFLDSGNAARLLDVMYCMQQEVPATENARKDAAKRRSIAEKMEWVSRGQVSQHVFWDIDRMIELNLPEDVRETYQTEVTRLNHEFNNRSPKDKVWLEYQ